MVLTDLQIVTRAPFADAQSFGDTGAYERVDAIAHYAVDPLDAANADIVDLDRAPRDSRGRVRFSSDVTILKPPDASQGNRAALLEVPNRGGRPAVGSILLGGPPTSFRDVPAGDGLLLRRGWSVAWCGWQWDVPRQEGRMGLEAPTVPRQALGSQPGQVQLRFQPSAACDEMPLTDQHVGSGGNHARVAPADVDDPSATLRVRDGIYGEARVVPREEWGFSRDSASLRLERGFEPGRIYDVVFRPAKCPVVGAGLLAVRDFATFLKRDDPANPLAGAIDHVVGQGFSQCGRFLRTYLKLGLNVDEGGQQALDGVLIHIAGGRRGEFNHRYAQPSVQPTPSFGHLFPFADDVQTDPATDVSAGLLERQRARGGVPRVFQTDTSSEYWRSDASLTHVDLATGEDVEPPEEVRRYLFASTQHGAGAPVLEDTSAFGTRGANHFSIVDYRPLIRAALVNLLDWVRGTSPPESVFPRWRDGTAATREDIVAKLERITPLALPDVDACPRMVPLDLGPEAASGIGTFPASVAGDAYPSFVSDVDDVGNETGGIRLPDIEVPVGTHTGFNPRHPETGGPGQILDYLGSTAPFDGARIRELYASRDAYLAAVRKVGERLARERYLLAEDIDFCVDNAAARYDLVVDR